MTNQPTDITTEVEVNIVILEPLATILSHNAWIHTHTSLN